MLQRVISVFLLAALLLAASPCLLTATAENAYAQTNTIAAGDHHSLAIKEDGSLWAWGFCLYGVNTAVSPLAPEKIMDDVVSVAAGNMHSLAIKADGSLWAWGNNQTGQIGDGTISLNCPNPIKIMDGVKLPASAITPPSSIPEPPTTPATITSFPDVPASHWAYSSIMLLVEKGVISGYADGLFRPNALVTRSEFAKMMYLALEIDKTADYSGVIIDQPFFADMTTDKWEYMYVKYVGRYMTGFKAADGQVYFKGSEPAVREDMAVALVKALNLESEVADDINAEYVYARLQQIFSDADTISPNLRKYVLLAYESDLIGGYTDGTFGAQKSITRAEAASLLVKVLKSAAMQKVTFN